jgi:uncharacterized protein YlzI (FlbEa/FlbD family)
VIRLRRLGQRSDVVYLNPDLIVSVEATPDTVVTLTTNTKILVLDSPDEVTAAVRAWRASVLQASMTGGVRPRRADAVNPGLALVRGSAAEPFHATSEEPAR